jgi:hypothetical protein
LPQRAQRTQKKIGFFCLSLFSLPDGWTIWRLRVNTENAQFMSFKFSEFVLPPGAELYFVSVYRDYQIGPFTQIHNQPTRRFGSPVIAGDSAVIELYLPQGKCDVALTLESVSHGYRNALGIDRFPYRKTRAALEKKQSLPLPPSRVKGNNFDCQRDINCPEGAPYQDEKRAVAEGYDGAYVCSGQLINNVRQDNRYLYITAAHCGWYEDPSTMSYYWNYENTGCGTNDYPPWTYSTGSTDLFHSTSGDRDVDLLELHGTDFEGTYNIYFMGWNRGETPPTMAAMISHPADKPKQIVIRYDPVIDCAVDNCPNGWGPLFWRIDGWDVGVDEGGSSGGGLMDQDHLLVGTLTGGVGTDCDDFAWDEFFKLSAEWTSLQPFLDPDNTGVMSIPGKDGLSGGPAANPDPADSATEVSVNATLSWTAGAGSDSSDVYFGTNSNPGSSEFQGNQAGTTFDPGTMTEDTTYYWRIDAVTGSNVVVGDVWSFTTEAAPAPPGQASSPNPGHGATDIAIDTQLSWTAGSQATTHKVYFGTNPNPGTPEYRGEQTGTTFDPGSLTYETDYYWRIDEVNALGTTTGTVWHFTTAVETFDIVTITEAVYKADRDEFKVKATSSEQPDAVLTLVDFGEMPFGKDKYELKIKPLAPLTAPSTVTVVSSMGGSATAPVAGAPTPAEPGQASGPSPADSASGVTLGTILSWSAGSDTDSHDVYFGTNPTPGPAEFQGNQTGTTFDPGTLAYDTTYYWRIDEVNLQGTTTGNVWSFTTEPEGTGDVVTILKAEWKADRQELKVEATSSEQPNATLTVVGFGTMTYKADKNKYELKIKPVDNPGTVTVTSSQGGSASHSVKIR